MPALRNPRRENFAHEVVAGTTLLAVYLGFRDTSSARSQASRLRARPDVQARIREIQEGELGGIGVGRVGADEVCAVSGD